MIWAAIGTKAQHALARENHRPSKPGVDSLLHDTHAQPRSPSLPPHSIAHSSTVCHFLTFLVSNDSSRCLLSSGIPMFNETRWIFGEFLCNLRFVPHFSTECQWLIMNGLESIIHFSRALNQDIYCICFGKVRTLHRYCNPNPLYALWGDAGKGPRRFRAWNHKPNTPRTLFFHVDSKYDLRFVIWLTIKIFIFVSFDLKAWILNRKLGITVAQQGAPWSFK